MDVLYDNIILLQIRLVNGLVLRLCIRLTKEDLYRHEGTIFLKHFSYPVLIGELDAVIVQIQGDLCSYAFLAAFVHLVLCAAVADPVHRRRPIFIRKSINMHFVRYHERRVETEPEMTDHIVLCRLVLIFLKEFCRSGERDLCDILFYLFGCHTKPVIGEFQRLLFRVHLYLDRRFVVIR